MVELEVVHDTHGYGVIEGLAGTAVVQNRLTVEQAELVSHTEGLNVGSVCSLLGGQEAVILLAFLIIYKLEQLLALGIAGFQLALIGKIYYISLSIAVQRSISVRDWI
jgi:hypothetical protein